MWSPLCTNQLFDMANKAGTASGYFVIHVTMQTVTTIGLVSGSWNCESACLVAVVASLQLMSILPKNSSLKLKLQ